MAAGREIHGEVVLDVELSGEERARQVLQEKFAKLEAKVNVNATFRKAQIQGALDAQAGKGRGLRVKVDAVFSKAQIQADLTEKASKGKGLRARVDAQFSRPQIQRALAQAIAGKTPTLRVDVDVRQGVFRRVVAAANGAQKEITSFEERERIKRETAEKNSDVRRVNRTKEIEAKGNQDRETAKKRTQGRLDVLEDQHAKRLATNEAAAALRSENIQNALKARLTAQNNLFEQRRILAAERSRRQIESRASKPILQKILLDANTINSSLADFDRTVSRALKTSLIAFSAYSAGVVVSLAAIGIAAEADFAKFEAASRRAASTAASSEISDAMANNTKSVHSFAEIAQIDLEKINAKAKLVSLETVGISATDAATGIQTLVQAGQTLPEALGNISIAAKFAQVNNEDLTKVTTDLAGAMAAAGIKSKDTTKFLNQVQLSSQNALGGAGDFLESLANGASASARAFGENNLQAQAFVQLLANTGTTGKTAGTQAAIVFRDFNKVIGQSGDKLKAMGIDTSSFTKTVTGIANAFDQVKKSGGNVTSFSKELGFTQRSLNNILRIVPQLQDLGPEGLNKIISQLKNSSGIIEEQVAFQRKGIAAQFDNLKDTVGNLAKTFGEAASGPVAKFLDLFAGNDSKLTEATGTVQKFGERFGEVVANVTKFVQTKAFTNGIETLVESVKVTVLGVSDTLQAFAGAFNDGSKAKSTFEAFADTVLAFSRVSASVLPRVAKIIGEILNFFIDHASAFESFAKLTLGVYAARKAFSLLINPVGQATAKVLELRSALIATAGAEAAGGFTSQIGRVAAAYGLLGKEAKLAAANVALLDVAQSGAFPTGGRFVTGAKAATKGTGGVTNAAAGDGLLALGTASKLGKGGDAAASSARVGATFEKLTPKVGKFASVMAKLGAVFGALVPEFVEAIPILGGVASAFAEVAVPVALLIGAAIAVAGVFTGIIKGFIGTIQASDSTKQGFERLGKALKAIGDATLFVIKIIFKLGEVVGEVIGKVLAYSIGAVANAVAGVVNAVGSVAGKIGGLFVGSAEAATTKTDLLTESLDKLREAQYQASFSTNQMAQANHTVALSADLMGQAQAQAAQQIHASMFLVSGSTDKAKDSTSKLITAVDGFQPAYAQAAAAGVSAMGQITSSAQTTEASLLAVQAAIQASLGQTANATQSIIDSELANPNVVIPGVSKRAALAANTEQKRQAALIASARKAQRDAKIVQNALGNGGVKIPAGSGQPSQGTPAQRKFVDPDEQIQASIDRLKPAQKAAQVGALIDKVTSKQGRSYQLTRRDALLLADAMPRIDAAVDKQRTAVEKLNKALTDLQDVQLAGTKAFTDASFANEQAVKKLQLDRLNLLGAGNTEGSAPVIAIDKQISDLQTAAEKADLEQSLQLDPLKKKLEETFNPVKELPFDQIIAQFQKLSAQRDTETAKLTSQEAVQAKLNARLDAAKTAYDKIDAASQRAVEAFNASQTAATGASTAYTGAATSVTKYAGAVEAVPSGKGVVDKSLKQINGRVTELQDQFSGAGSRVTSLFAAGVAAAIPTRLQPALTRVVNNVNAYLATAANTAQPHGEALMQGFLTGMETKFDAEGKKKGSIAYFLNVFIPDWIRKNKGPVAYDATILVPAGEAVMQGFGRGLRSGFSQIQSFVKDVGPSLSEYVSTDLFSQRTATIMADIAVGKTPNIEAALADMRPGALNLPGFSGPVDASLGFLHPTLSLEDTAMMAQGLAKLFHLQVTALRDDHSKFTASGNISDHALGLAADLSNSSGGGDDPASNTPQMLALAKALEPLQGKVIKQLIYQNRDRRTGAFIGGHQNHDHVSFLPGKGFSVDSGKLGKPLVTDIPGASDRIDAAISAASAKYGVELALLAAVAKQESNFQPNAASPAGAKGLFQFIPSTAAGFGINPLIPEQAADGGARYLKNLLTRFSGRYDFALAGYNAGPGAVDKYHGVPPFPETQNYVSQVTRYLDQFRKQFGGFREAGGPVQAGKSYVVGEKRAEIFVPRTNGTILPDANATMAGSGRTYQDNRTIQVDIKTQASDAQAIHDVFEARTRSRMAGVNFR